MIAFKSPAKINVGLFVYPKRNDGYHPLDTLFFGIDLFDTLHIKKSKSFQLSCSSKIIPIDHTNIITKTWDLFCKHHRPTTSLSIHLQKELPSEAGIGGASGNAALILWLLNRIHDKPFNSKQLHKLALEIGADVPFFLQSSPCFAQGIGEIFSPLDNIENIHLVLVKPSFSIKTSSAFSFLDSVNREHSQVPKETISSILNSKSYHLLGDHLSNDFELIPGESSAQISLIKQSLYQKGASYASLSGSGSSIYGLFKNQYLAKETFLDFSKDHETYLCQTINDHSPASLNLQSLNDLCNLD